MLATLTMLPERCAAITGAAYFIPAAVPPRWMASVRCSRSRSRAAIPPGVPPSPAQFTRQSSRPCRSAAPVISAAMSASDATSARTNSACGPSLAACASPSATRRPAITTRAPSPANSSAVRAPMPLVPPVITATLPSRTPTLMTFLPGCLRQRCRTLKQLPSALPGLGPGNLVPGGPRSPGGGMTHTGAVRQRRELGEFLASRRAKLRPEQAGVSAGSRRRVAGLRRQEVAEIAGVSVDYYVRLEQGRAGNAHKTPSAATVKTPRSMTGPRDQRTQGLVLTRPAPGAGHPAGSSSPGHINGDQTATTTPMLEAGTPW
jgi:hypothetical protein